MFAQYVKSIHVIFPYATYAIAGILIPTTCSIICQQRRNRLEVFQYMFGIHHCIQETDLTDTPKTIQLLSGVACFARILHCGVPLPASIMISMTTDIVATNVGKFIANIRFSK